ncbi:hypothetical protein [Kingella denitrificans]
MPAALSQKQPARELPKCRLLFRSRIAASARLARLLKPKKQPAPEPPKCRLLFIRGLR